MARWQQTTEEIPPDRSTGDVVQGDGVPNGASEDSSDLELG